jgi:hypothetical protein
MSKFKSPHDEFVWQKSVDGFYQDSGGDDSGPVGWFAAVDLQAWQSNEEQDALTHYGTPWLILHVSNEGFVTVLPFDAVSKRDRRIVELQQAHDLGVADVSEQQIVQAISGYRRALEWHAGFDGAGHSWTEEAQTSTGDEVTDFVTQNIEDLRIYMQVVNRTWEAIGGDFAFSRVGSGMGFTEYAGGDVATDLRASAEAFGQVAVVLNEKQEMEVRAA